MAQIDDLREAMFLGSVGDQDLVDTPALGPQGF